VTKQTTLQTRGCSSAGRAPALQAGGQGFEPPHLQKKSHLTLYRLLGFQVFATTVGRLRRERGCIFCIGFQQIILKLDAAQAGWVRAVRMRGNPIL
jgi:hypothetical protein